MPAPDAADAIRALDEAKPGPVAEGNVGGGTGMICHEFKGGIGTASRRVPDEQGGWTVGALVQALSCIPLALLPPVVPAFFVSLPRQ